jgi:hypothetical protein
MHNSIGGGGGGQVTLVEPPVPPEAPPVPPEPVPPLAGSDGADSAQPVDAPKDWQVQPVVQSASAVHGFGTAWQLPVLDGAHVQSPSIGGAAALPLVPPAAMPAVPLEPLVPPVPPESPEPTPPGHAHSWFTTQPKPAPQSVSAWHGKSYLGVHCCVTNGSHTGSVQSELGGQAMFGHGAEVEWQTMPDAQSLSLVQDAGTQDLISVVVQSGGGLHVSPAGQAKAQPLPPVTAQLKPLAQSESC